MNDTPKNKRRSILAGTGLFGAAVAIATAVWVSNGGTGVAAACPARADAAQAIDDAATGELAALLPSTEWRNFADLAFIDAGGNAMTLADLSGKKLLVNFWATWCAPCREEMPDLDTIQAEYGGESFEVVAISLDLGSDGPTAAQSFLDEIGADNLALYADPSYKVFERLRNEAVTLGLPATVLVDEGGCEIAVLQGPAHWDSDDGRRVVETLLEI
ncbi:TlpA family protein disulfide reductase [Pelagibacterium xiamenense]|uniref:TlpA family protein disulfide reductase n=1 Tax=Pelagibacterium xiamenense TaxID=2901140 RepID=UPI001E3D0810|nr:TlpA disulfide reductase family protein [Pelagibacterium xiamenense]MCD7061300.1 TlpA family protein disulfide reductase [Pelagibacterium xiamenense]